MASQIWSCRVRVPQHLLIDCECPRKQRVYYEQWRILIKNATAATATTNRCVLEVISTAKIADWDVRITTEIDPLTNLTIEIVEAVGHVFGSESDPVEGRELII